MVFAEQIKGDLFGSTETDFNRVRIQIASPEKILSWSHGEVKNPETINYRTFKPERGGLFCERIFGPTKDFECNCGKYKRIKHKGVVCDRCGVEVVQSKVRRERMGHIELAVPVTHIWFFKTTPSRIGNMLGLSTRTLERVIYYEDYIVIDPGETDLEVNQLMNELEYREARGKYGATSFTAKMGAEAVGELLMRIDQETIIKELREKMRKCKSVQTKKKIAKRLKILEGFSKSGNKPEWMILKAVPVIPPDLRPLVPLEGGRFATSDLNDLYRRVINRNNRLKNILDLKTPEVIIRNEKRMLQEAVDALFDNGRHGRPVMASGNRPLKSFAEMLRGKQGRFRQNLLGKRVDYSGRSVIVVGPNLKIHQCGLPKKMALELFEPFIIKQLKQEGYVHTIRKAKKLIERGTPEVWDILESVTRDHPVMLNRAPTLHRLGIQAFEPILIEGKAITLHPLVCTAFNADFDGDQMAVHVPLSLEAQMEAKILMMSSNNIFSPAHGRPLATPTQDIILGIYYITREPDHDAPVKGMFGSFDEVILARQLEQVHANDKILVRLKNGTTVETTVGRVVFNDILPEEIDFINETISKKKMGQVIEMVYKNCGHEMTVDYLDMVKDLGYREATKAGISMGIQDMIIPDHKDDIIQEAMKSLDAIRKQYQSGVITEGERYNKVIDVWTHATDTISDMMYRDLQFNRGKKTVNPVYVMVDSGARGSRQQIRQLAGMRGLMAKPSGDIIETPITSNFREGLSVLEYFISTHGARKGLADTALKTGDAGYLTRRLVDVAQDVIILVEDCGTLNGITVRAVYEGDEEVVSLEERIFGRYSLEDIVDPVSGEVVCEADQLITREVVGKIKKLSLDAVKIRSVLTCECPKGICRKCYGINLATGEPVDLGESVGIIAAQSIGEPGTQLTMRTFHIGGTAFQVFKQPVIKARVSGRVQYNNVHFVEKDGEYVVLKKGGMISLIDKEGREVDRYSLTMGSILTVPDYGEIKKDKIIARWDPYNVPILSEKEGVVAFHDVVEGITVKNEIDEATGLAEMKVVDHKEDLHPQIVIRDRETKEPLAYYSIPTGAHIIVVEGDEVSAGGLLAKTPRKIMKTKDITGGLPRVAELFEARHPKEAADIAKIDGNVEFCDPYKGKRRVIVRDPETGVQEEHLIPFGSHLTVYRGDYVRKGQQLTEGPIAPQEILEVSGIKELQEYLLNQIQEVYRLQGVTINYKHVEIIIRQMLRKVRITEPGTTEFLFDDVVDRLEFDRENQKTAKEGGQPAEAAPLLQGITKASLSTDSFISAASFQETTRVLTDATANGKVDNLFGFKENVIMGHIIPAGTGFRGIQELKYEKSELELALREKSDFDIDDVKHIIDESEETVKNMPELEEETESETPEEEATEAYPEDDPDKQTGEEE
jgi:DNA-directed RNA polymerase subunit beta'